VTSGLLRRSSTSASLRIMQLAIRASPLVSGADSSVLGVGVVVNEQDSILWLRWCAWVVSSVGWSSDIVLMLELCWWKARDICWFGENVSGEDSYIIYSKDLIVQSLQLE